MQNNKFGFGKSFPLILLTIALFLITTTLSFSITSTLDYEFPPFLTLDSSQLSGGRIDYSGSIVYTLTASIPSTVIDSSEVPQDIIIKPLTQWSITLPTNLVGITFSSSKITTTFTTDLTTTQTDNTVVIVYNGETNLTLGSENPDVLKGFITLQLTQTNTAPQFQKITKPQLTIQIGPDAAVADKSITDLTDLSLSFTNTQFGIMTVKDKTQSGTVLGSILTKTDVKMVENYFNQLPIDQLPNPLPTPTTIIVSSGNTNQLELEFTLIPELIKELFNDDTLTQIDLLIELNEYQPINNTTDPQIFSKEFFTIATYKSVKLTVETPVIQFIFDQTPDGQTLPPFSSSQTFFKVSMIPPTPDPIPPTPTTTSLTSTEPILTPSTTINFNVVPQCIIQPTDTTFDTYYNPTSWTRDYCSPVGARGCDYTTGKCRCRYNFFGPMCTTETDICGTVCKPEGTDMHRCTSNTLTVDKMRTSAGCVCHSDYQGPDCSIYFAVCLIDDDDRCAPFGAPMRDQITRNCDGKCFCANKWEGDNCRSCPLNCQNNSNRGIYSCNKCNCPSGFSGDECQCQSRQGSIIIKGQNDVYNAFHEWSYEPKAPLLKSSYHQISQTLTEIVQNGLKSSNVEYSSLIFDNLGKWTRMNFTFAYGCKEHNVDLDEAKLITAWNNLQPILLDNGIISQLYDFVSPVDDQQQQQQQQQYSFGITTLLNWLSLSNEPEPTPVSDRIVTLALEKTPPTQNTAFALSTGLITLIVVLITILF